MRHTNRMFGIALVALLATAFSAHAQESLRDKGAGADSASGHSASDQSGSNQSGSSASAFPAGLDPEAALLARLSGLFNIEDPTSVFNYDINDNEVEFILDGTWEMKIESFIDVTFDGGSPLFAFTPPVFTQAVDLSSWVLINDTWYFESAFAEEFTKNSVAAGFIGGDGDAIRHVRVGNSGITFPGTYTFVSIGGGTAIAPGFMGTFAGDRWSADAIVRYDAAATRVLVLSGMNEVSDEYVSVTTYVQGKWFVLPEAPVTGAVDVYVTDEDGAYADSSSRVGARRWRKLDPAEFTVRGTDGILELKTETAESVAVVYYGTYASSSTTPLSSLISFAGETFSFFDALPGSMPSGFLPNPSDADYLARLSDRFLTDIGGRTALIVRESGHFSPFTLCSRYRAEGGEAVVMYEETGISPDYLDAQDYDGVFVDIIRDDGLSSPGIRTPETRYPLAPEFPLLYLPAGGGQKADTDLTVRSRAWKPVSTISLGEDAIAGTIQVTRNGISDTAFGFDEDSGILTLERIPSSTESVRITWLDTDQGARNATLTLGGGIHWNPFDRLSFFSATAFRWNISKSGFTDSGESSPGSFILSAGSRYSGPEITAATAFALDVSVPDTTGYYRAIGMDSGTNSLYPGEEWYETVPDGISPALGLPARAAPVVLNPGDRVATAGTSGDQPGTVSDSSMTGAVLVLSCDLVSPASWAGADIVTGEEASTDWSSVSTVSLWLRNPGTETGFDVYLQLGNGSSEYSEDAETIRTWKLETPPQESGWVKRTVTLGDADRAALSSGENMRVIVVPSFASAPTQTSPVAVNLRTGMISYTDSPFTSIASPAFSGAGLLATEETGDPAPTTLVNAEADVSRRFNSGGVNTVLITRFTPEADTETVTVSRHIRSLPLESYGKLTFFVYAESLPNPDGSGLIRLSLSRSATSLSGEKEALEMEIDASALTAGQWHEVSVDMEARSVSLDGSAISSAARVLTLDRDVSPTHVSFIFENWEEPDTPPASGETAYTVAIDELYLSQSEIAYTLRNKSDFSWKKDGALISAGRTALISDPRVSVTADTSVRHDGNDPQAFGTADGGLKLLGIRADGTLTASSATARAADSESHSVMVPLGPLSLNENYRADFAGNDFKRDDAIALSGPVDASLAAGVRLEGRNLVRTASAKLEPRIPSSAIGAFRLSAASDFSQTGLSPRTDISDTGWDTLWTDTFAYSLSTGESDAKKRTGKTAAHAAWLYPADGEDRVYLSGITFDADAASTYAASTAVSLGSKGSFALALPVRIGYSTLTPSWRRTAAEECAVDAGGSYLSDTEFLSSSLSRLSYLFTTAPVADLFASDIADRIADYGNYSRSFGNRYGLAWGRPSLGKPSDLWIPTSIDSSIARETETDATVTNVSDEWTATARIGLSALNIAGTYGALRLFDWYEQDEISQLYSWNAVWGSSYFTWNADTLHSILLMFTGTGSLAFENNFHYDSPDIAGDGRLYRDTVRVVWKRPGKDSILSSVIAGLTRLPLATSREDSFSCTVTISDVDSTAISYDHILRTGIGANGEVSLTGGSGYTRTSEGSTSVEIRLGMGGKLTY